ncbi:MAG: hypothetical protein Kow00105_10530 [Phycisphaeraceae bacterium]
MGLMGKFSRALRTVALALGMAGGMMLTASADAGVLNGHASAFNDGNGPSGGAWTGSTSFDNGIGLSGSVEWAVFGPGSFPFSGYTPAPGELTYAFQVFSTGTDAIHSLSIQDPSGTANNIGSFSDLSGEVPSGSSLIGQAQWLFTGLDLGENSVGLAFSSIRIPDSLFGVIGNGGSFAVAIPLPVPGANDIPEPASLALMGLGSVMVLRRRK